MNPRTAIGAATALLLVACGPALAQESAARSSIETVSFTPWSPAAFGPGLVPGSAAGPGPAPRFETVRYQPRHRPPPSNGLQPSKDTSRRPATAHLQLHGGFMERNGDGPTSFALGFRGGPSVGDVVQLGLGVDWYHESESEREVVGSSFQGGRPVTTTNVLARTTADLIPIQAHLQLGGAGRLPLGPYVGIGGGYQYLLLSASDYQTGADFDATYGGWGWQVWGGMALRLSGQARLFGEVFMNTGTVERDVKDPASGASYREGTDTDGAGMRFGLNWGM